MTRLRLTRERPPIRITPAIDACCRGHENQEAPAGRGPGRFAYPPAGGNRMPAHHS